MIVDKIPILEAEQNREDDLLRAFDNHTITGQANYINNISTSSRPLL